MPAQQAPGPLCAGFIAGAALQLQQATLWRVDFYLGLLAFVALVIAGCRLAALRRSPAGHGRMAGMAGIAVFFCAAAIGFSLTGWRAGVFQAAALKPAMEGRDILVTGEVAAMPQISEDALRFRFVLDSAQLDGQAVVLPPQLLLGWYSPISRRDAKRPVAAAPTGDSDVSELDLLRLPQVMRAGERWQMTVRLKAPHGNSNPFGFDYELWLWEQGIHATGYVRAGAKEVPPKKLSSHWTHPIERARQAVREAIFERIENRQLAGLLAALVMGDQNAIERADWDVFRATGVAHLMSISGLHITMFAWLSARLLRGFWRRSAGLTPRLCHAVPASTAGAWGGLLLATLYALFSGWGVPAQRTIWMLACMVMLRHSARQWPWQQAWLLAMAVVVALDPWALMQAGFWLSFVAVGILFATDSAAKDQSAERVSAPFFLRLTTNSGGWARVASRLAQAASGLAGSLREQWVVTLALTPLSLLLFNQVSVVGLLANAVAIPWVTLVVTPLAMAGVVWAPVWDAAAWSARLLTLWLHWLSGWSLASVSVAAAPLWCAMAGVAGGALLAMRLPWHWQVLGIPLMLPVLLWQPVRVAPGQFEVLAADIGQGNAVLVRTASHALLYDTGPSFSRESDAGHRVLVPLLRALGERLDRVMLSHRDSDHIGGAPAVLAMQPQADLFSSIEDSHPLQALRHAVRCVAGQHWDWDGVAFDVLHPQAADYDAPAKSNAMSCVLRISNGVHTALLVGDIEAPQESRLVRDEAPERLKADFLLVPHHGSKTSSSAVFLDAVRPQIAVAQAGYRNRFGHPVQAVMARYDERAIPVVRSAWCGASTWQSLVPGQIDCQRARGKRYWQHAPDPMPR